MATKRQRSRKTKARQHHATKGVVTTQLKKRHHFVPQLHLRGFAKDSQVMAVPLGDGQPRRRYIRSAAANDYFYRIDAPAGAANLLEDWFGNAIESPAAPALRRLEAGVFPPDQRDRYRIANFVAAQLLRTPRTRAAIQDHATLSMQVEVLNRRDELQQRPHWDDVSKFNWRVAVGADAHALAIRELFEMYAAYLFSLHWSRVVFERYSLLTSDNPVAMWRDGVKTDPFGIGIATADEFWFPVSRRCALGMASFPIPSPELSLEPSRRRATEINQLLANSAWEWIFHHPDDNPLDGVIVPPPRRAYHVLPEIKALQELLDEAEANAPAGHSAAIRPVPPTWTATDRWKEVHREMGRPGQPSARRRRIAGSDNQPDAAINNPT